MEHILKLLNRIQVFGLVLIAWIYQGVKFVRNYLFNHSLDGVWLDDGGVYEESIRGAKSIARSRKKSAFTAMHFGGLPSRGRSTWKM